MVFLALAGAADVISAMSVCARGPGQAAWTSDHASSYCERFFSQLCR
jgi:hypothetical protein